MSVHRKHLFRVSLVSLVALVFAVQVHFVSPTSAETSGRQFDEGDLHGEYAGGIIGASVVETGHTPVAAETSQLRIISVAPSAVASHIAHGDNLVKPEGAIRITRIQASASTCEEQCCLDFVKATQACVTQLGMLIEECGEECTAQQVFDAITECLNLARNEFMDCQIECPQ